jgi:hypothetical protein
MKTLVKLLMLLTLGAVICLPGMALADTTFQQFTTDFKPNAFYLWMDQTNPVFSGVTGLPAGWDLFIDESGKEYISTNNTNNSNITFTQSWTSTGAMPTFSFQWAEVSWDANWGKYTLLGSGTLSHTTGWVVSSNFTHGQEIQSPVPLPPTVLLLATGLLGLIGLRRQFKSGNKDDFI